MLALAASLSVSGSACFVDDSGCCQSVVVPDTISLGSPGTESPLRVAWLSGGQRCSGELEGKLRAQASLKLLGCWRFDGLGTNKGWLEDGDGASSMTEFLSAGLGCPGLSDP